MSATPDIHIEELTSDTGAIKRVLIEEPNEDIRHLLAVRCSRLGLSPLIHEPNGNGHLPEVDLIVVEPGSVHAQRLLRTHRTVRSTIPVICVSIYPPTNGLHGASVVAYLVKPCSWEQFESAVWQAIGQGAPPVMSHDSGLDTLGGLGPGIGGNLGEGDDDLDGGSLVGPAFQADGAAVRLDDGPDDRQA